MSSVGHKVVKCSCGAIISQCRCPDTGTKAEETLVNGCDTCKALVPAPPGDNGPGGPTQ